jgi:NAD(P)-dependent dehydrogenase (short-subunit alcohol dehydrogenase family)
MNTTIDPEPLRPYAWSDRVAFISGGASGIGFGLAQALAARGVRIALSDVRQDALAEASEALRRDGAEVLAVPGDVADRHSVRAVADTVEQHFGKVHYVFNNAGVGDLGTPLYEEADENFDWMVDVNLRGVFNAIKAFVPKLRRHGERGHIVNTSSMAGLVTEAGWNQGTYSATKRAVIGLSLDLRASLRGSNVGVSVLCPGLVRTDIEANAATLRPSPKASIALPALLATASMPARAAGEIVLRRMENGDFYIITHPELWPRVESEQMEVRRAFNASAQWLAEMLHHLLAPAAAGASMAATSQRSNSS